MMTSKGNHGVSKRDRCAKQLGSHPSSAIPGWKHGARHHNILKKILKMTSDTSHAYMQNPLLRNDIKFSNERSHPMGFLYVFVPFLVSVSAPCNWKAASAISESCWPKQLTAAPQITQDLTVQFQGFRR